MSIREDIERMECETLSPYATLSIHSRGRDDPEEQCDIRPVFQRDRDRILHCKAFRRLKNKTQVLIAGKIYTLSGYESEEYLQKVATYINNKLAELKKMDGYNHLSSDTKSILVDLNVADVCAGC